MSEPITITLYGENDEPIKTYSRSRISWEFWKKSLHARVPENGALSDDNLHTIREFVCNFYDNQFTEEELIEQSDVNEVLLVAARVGQTVFKMMKDQGIPLPNVQTATE